MPGTDLTGTLDAQAEGDAPVETADHADWDKLSDLPLDVDGPDLSDTSSAAGELWVLTYNVAGLPQGISKSDPEKNIPQISPLLNSYDLVLVQEDFAYHAELSAGALHPYKSVPWTETHVNDTMGDGLNRFSSPPFGPLTRIPWPGCSGLLDCSSDCLATKGFSFARHELAPGTEVDIYNLHMEAGGCPEDEELRAEGLALLLDTIAEQSQDVAVIVAGDFNLHDKDSIDVELLDLIVDAGFIAACWYLECGESHIDRIFVRDGGGITLVPKAWEVPSAFLDENGEDLSDHEPVAALIGFQSIK